MSDAQERTEQATDRHLKEVRSKGRLQKSRDLSAWVSVGAGAAMIPVTVSRAQSAAEAQLSDAGHLIDAPTTTCALAELASAFGSLGNTIWPMLVVVALASIVATVAQGGVHPRRFELRTEQFNIVKGIGRLFGPRTGWEAVKTLAKAGLVAAGFAVVIQSWLPVVLQSGGLSISALLSAAGDGVWTLLRTAIGAGLLFAGFDVVVVIRRNRKASRMTKREVKDENKNTDGDPLVRAHRRSRQLAMSRNRMIAAIPDASVVVVNPTHVAVALAYEAGTSAPRVVAKGADLVATRIREEAVLHGVPLVKDVPLARTLYAQCQLGQEIPVDCFTPVTQVLAFVMALKKRGASLNDVFTLPQPHQGRPPSPQAQRRPSSPPAQRPAPASGAARGTPAMPSAPGAPSTAAAR